VPEKIAEETRPKRDAILDAARTLFAKQGYEETTIADIARAAGVAVGTVYLSFLSISKADGQEGEVDQWSVRQSRS